MQDFQNAKTQKQQTGQKPGKQTILGNPHFIKNKAKERGKGLQLSCWQSAKTLKQNVTHNVRQRQLGLLDL